MASVTAVTVSVWVPIAVALIAAIPILYTAVASRKGAKETKLSREAELVVTGLTALVNELQEERTLCVLSLRECREEVQRLRA